MNDRPIRGAGHDGGRRPVVGFLERVPLDPEGIAIMQEAQALLIKRLEMRREESGESPDSQLYWTGMVKPDFSGLPDEKREAIEDRIALIRADPEWRARFKRNLENVAPELARLMEVDPDGGPS